MQTRERILSLVRVMPVGYGLAAQKSRLIHHKDTALIRTHPYPALLVLENIVSPGSRILATLIVDDEVAHLTGTAVIEVDAMVGTDPYIAVMVFINLAYTVMTQREGRAVLLVPCHILITFSIPGKMNQTIGTAHPPFAVTGLEHGMETVALTRHRNLIERYIAVIGMGSETGETIVSTHPYILPFIYKASPDDVVRNRSIIAGIVDIMGDGIGECHLIESVICSDIEIAGSICRKTFDGIAVESWNL